MKKYDICLPVIKSECKHRKLALKYTKKYYSQYFNVIDSEIEEYNPSKARNFSIEKSKNEIVIVIDADILIDEKIIHTAIEYATKYDILVRPFGRLLWLNRPTSEYLAATNDKLGICKQIKRIQLEKPFFITYSPDFDKVNQKYKNLVLQNPECGKPGNCWYSWGGAFVLKRKLFNILGGFDERFKEYGWEDVAFCRKVELMNIKTKILFSDGLHLHHTRPKNYDQHNHVYNNFKLLGQEPYNMEVTYNYKDRTLDHITMPKILLFK